MFDNNLLTIKTISSQLHGGGGEIISIWSICVEGLKALNRGQVKEGWHNIGIQLYASDMKF